MEQYYEELKERIENYISQKQYHIALAIVDEELNMPYIPNDVEAYLYQVKKDLAYYLSEDFENKEYSIDKLFTYLQGTPEQQIFAVDKLSHHNLREHVERIQNYLQDNPYPNAAALLIETLALQEINEEFIYNKDGIEYTFFPEDVIPVAASMGTKVADTYLKNWLENDNPDYYQMAKVLLVSQSYAFLPLSYEESEGYDLAYDVINQLSEMVNEPDLMNVVKERKSILLN